MSYLVFARKYRPQTLTDLVGQEHVATTLRNALKQGRIAQSFLFSGTRGVGKTSSARILAKMLNCEKGKPGDDPCQKCASCVEITRGSGLDVLEIDGASNRGIDEIRNLRESVKFKPMTGKYKIFIIDEVHMLTGEAFNALLKTLEEPPEHVKFVFATTEVHKVPLTILSRCQRFVFRRIPATEIIKTLEGVAKEEGIKVDKESLFLIAKQAEGSLRDGESLLEQMVSFCGKNLKREEVEEALGLSSQAGLFAFVDAISSKDSKAVLELLDELIARGQDLAHFVTGLLETFRSLLMSQVLEKPEKFIEMSEEGLELVRKNKSKFSREDLFMILESLQELNWKIRRSNNPRILAEVSLLELANRESVESLSALVKELKALREGGAPAPRASASPAPRPSYPSQPSASTRPSAPPSPASGNVKKNPEPVNRPVAAIQPNRGGEAFPEIESAWFEIVEAVKVKKMSAGSYLAESRPMGMDGRDLLIGFPVEFRFHKEAMDKKDNVELVQAIITEKTGSSVGVKFVIAAVDGATVNAGPAKPSPVDDKVPDIISEAMNIFEGRILRKD